MYIKLNEAYDKIEISLKTLRKELSKEYPKEHWNHIPIWSAFWALVETIDPGLKHKL